MKNSLDNLINLERLTKEHMLKTFVWVSNAELRAAFLIKNQITWNKHINYFKNALEDSSQILYAILYESEHIGNCGYKHLNVVDASAELWIYLGSSETRGKGIGYAAARLLLKEGVECLGLKKIQVHVAENNRRARQLYANLGFVDEGLAGPEWEGHSCRILKMLWRVK